MIKNNFNSPIGVFDSGVGGITVLNELKRVLPNENYIYLGDNKNTPYGNKSKPELLALVKDNINMLLKYGVKAVVLGCNTLSVCLIEEIKKEFSTPIFGVFPPINKEKKTLLLATKRTSEKFENSKKLTVYACNDFAYDIEQNIFSLEKVKLKEHIKLSGIFDEIVLGCTHYSFLKKEIEKTFNLKTTSGEVNTANLLKEYLIKNNLLSKCHMPKVYFIGDCFLKNMKVYHKYKNDL
ncbi:MAG: glutamate racemase [Clostridia bacterium]|nr:glutamate racemase [Clostridia bacterium]